MPAETCNTGSKAGGGSARQSPAWPGWTPDFEMPHMPSASLPTFSTAASRAGPRRKWMPWRDLSANTCFRWPMPSPATVAEAMLARWPGTAGPASRLATGHINETWTTRAHILQRINEHVFAEPTALMRNLGRAVAHAAALPGHPPLVAPLANAEGEAWSVDAEGGIWRLFPRVRSRSFDVLPEPLLEAAGRAFGDFLARFAPFDAASLETAIDGFHDLPSLPRPLRCLAEGRGASGSRRHRSPARGRERETARRSTRHPRRLQGEQPAV